jgi:hypothetical protein
MPENQRWLLNVDQQAYFKVEVDTCYNNTVRCNVHYDQKALLFGWPVGLKLCTLQHQIVYIATPVPQ